MENTASTTILLDIQPTRHRIIVLVAIPYLLPFQGCLLFPDGHSVPHYFPTETILRRHWQQCLLRRLKAVIEYLEDEYYPEKNADVCVDCGVEDMVPQQEAVFFFFLFIHTRMRPL